MKACKEAHFGTILFQNSLSISIGAINIKIYGESFYIRF